MSATQVYRKLLKAQRFTFAADQSQVKSNLFIVNIIDAQRFTRMQFEKNASVADPEEIQKLLKIGDQAAIIIERNIVQGIQNRDSIFSLQLNENKEMNDNASIKSAKKQPPQKI